MMTQFKKALTFSKVLVLVFKWILKKKSFSIFPGEQARVQGAYLLMTRQTIFIFPFAKIVSSL